MTRRTASTRRRRDPDAGTGKSAVTARNRGPGAGARVRQPIEAVVLDMDGVLIEGEEVGTPSASSWSGSGAAAGPPGRRPR